MAKVAPVLVSVIVTLGVVAGGLTLDKTVLHWYSETASGPAASEVLDEVAKTTPSGPIRTAPEIMQAIAIQDPDWCSRAIEGFVLQLPDTPSWDQRRKIWSVGCLSLNFVGDSSIYTSCTNINDVTLEMSKGPNSNEEDFQGC